MGKFIEVIPRPFLTFSLFLLIFLYAGFAFAYNLFYIPSEGRPIEIANDLYKPERRLFERVDVIKVTKNPVDDYSVKAPQPTGINRPKEETQSHSTSQVVTDKTSPTRAPPSETSRPPQPQTQQASSTPKSTTLEQQLPKVESTVQQQKPEPISTAEVSQLSSKFGLSALSDNSIIELHITQSQGEVFTVYVLSGMVNVGLGESPNEDIEVWIDRTAIKEILTASDISYTAKRLAGERKISVIQKTSTWTLYRKGYKGLAEKLGLT